MSNLKLFFRLVKPKYLVLLTILAIFSSWTPFISFWGLSKVIDTISVVIGSTSILLYIGLIGIFLVTNDSFEAIRWTYSTYLEGKFFLELKGILLSKVCSWPYIDIFENAVFLNKLSLVEQSIPRFHGFFNSLAMLTSGLLGSLPFFWIGFITSWWVPFALMLAFLPSLLIKWNLEERLWALEIQNGEEYKEAALHESILLSPHFAKEVRLWNAGQTILSRWKKNRTKLLTETSGLRNKSMCLTFLASLFEGIVDCAIIVYLYTLLMSSRLSAGNFVFAITAVTQLRQNAFTVLLFGLDIRVAFKRLLPFFDILTMNAVSRKECQVDTSGKLLVSIDKTSVPIISLYNVSFSYPGCNEKVLKNISYDIRAKEKIALVGVNGSGKTTLVKLISGMYPLLEGNYIFKGIPYQSIDPEEFRTNFSAVYQDFAHFPLTLKENIFISRSIQYGENAGDKNSNEKNFSNLLSRFPINNVALGPDVLLTKQMDGGLDLSGGEWQRVALMRCAHANREIVLLDEPTASLDPDSEHDVLDTMLEIIKDKTAIIVTHRLALCQKVDRIIVLDKGEIIETGTHAELMSLNKHYANMYRKQGDYYVSKT